MIPTGAELMRRVLDSRLLDVHTAMPGKVLAWYPTTQTVDVQPQVKHVIEADDGDVSSAESYPRLRGIPVAFPRFGGYMVASPLSVGDFVTVLFHEWSLDRFLSQGLEAHPVDAARHGWAGAVAVPCGPFPQSAPITETLDGLVVGKDGGTCLKVDAAGILHLGDTLVTDAVVKGTTYRTAEDTLITALNTFVGALGEALTADLAAATPTVAYTPTAVTALATTLAEAVTAFQDAAATYLSTTVKTK
jgi:hypothetical protein